MLTIERLNPTTLPAYLLLFKPALRRPVLEQAADPSLCVWGAGGPPTRLG